MEADSEALLKRVGELEDELEKAHASGPTRRVATWRPTVSFMSTIVLGIVFLSYHYTGSMFADAVTLLKDASEPADVKDAIIQFLGAVAQSIVAVGALGILGGPINKLAEK